MELELTRVDYTIVGITAKNCMQLLPPVLPKEPQKVAVADSEGILQVFSVKKEDIQLHFKTLPGNYIASLKLAGASGTVPDKIFVAAGNEVRGFTKKGKTFLTFDAGMTESIISMFVIGNELFLCGKHVYNHYRDCKEVGSYLCGDVIVDILAFYPRNNRRLMSLIACEGRMIRILEHARVTFSIEVESSPTTLHLYENDDFRAVLFGTIDGKIGILDVENSQAFDKWLINNTKNTSAISCVDSYDLTSNGIKNLIIGRVDGNVEVYNVEEGMDEAIVIFETNCNESISSLQCGVVGSQGYDEILLVTYTGRVVGLTTQVVDANFDGSTGAYVFSADASSKINKLKSDIEDLQSRISKERTRYQNSTQSFFEELSAIPLLPVNTTLSLDKETSTYCLNIEIPTAIDNVLLQCNTKINLLDVQKNSAVVSYSESDSAQNYLLATYRCQMNTNRLELKLRTVEGQKGTLLAYVSPLVQPKCCRVLQFEIKALSLHFRTYNFDSNRPFNVLSIKGKFSLAEIHSWIGQCLPDVPEKPHISEKTVLWFQSSLLGTVLECEYQKGEAEFKSDNVSTISILKEFLTAEATKRKIKVDLSAYVNDSSLDHVIKLLEPKLLRQQQLSKDITLLDALEELQTAEDETSNCLPERYKSLLDNSKELRALSLEQSGYLDRLYGTIADLYTDYNKFKGINVKNKTSKILGYLQNYTYERLMSFFKPEMSVLPNNM